jgi:dipeptidyl-peptidase-4
VAPGRPGAAPPSVEVLEVRDHWGLNRLFEGVAKGNVSTHCRTGTSDPRWLADGERFLWATERGGAWQIELRDRGGALLQTLTRPELGLRGLVAVDEGRGALVVRASEDPTQVHLWRITLADGQAERLTEVPGVHDATFAEDDSRWVLASTTLAGEVRWAVRDAAGAELATLRSVAEAPPWSPRVELTTVGEGPERLHAALIRPRDFDAARRYPVLVHVYGGPHHQHVTANGRSYLLDQWFADQGTVVVRLDGRGTPSRGRAWERAIRGDFLTAPLADRVRGLQALGARCPELDLTRVGIHGWSFGGTFSAMAVMRRPDAFHAAVAGAPVTDWRDYDTHYTERYLGLPDEAPEAYRVSDVLTYAAQPSRPLLLLHGTADDNVYFTHSVRLPDALFRAGIAHEFLPLSGFTHMVPDPNVTTRLHHRIRDHFAAHLAPR